MLLLDQLLKFEVDFRGSIVGKWKFATDFSTTFSSLASAYSAKGSHPDHRPDSRLGLDAGSREDVGYCCHRWLTADQ